MSQPRLLHTYADELSDLVTPIKPTPVYQPQLQVINHELWDALGLPKAWHDNDAFMGLLFNRDSILTQHSVAQKYGGHQFGQWNPQLGDGRGVLLTEVEALDGSRHDLHLKGAGPTPYSRHADGRAVLRSTIREYLASEALHHLNIPTSRALCLISSNEPVYRETLEKAALMIRTAPSHLRFGHFEYFYHDREAGSDPQVAPDKLDRLMQYALTEHFPEALQTDNPHLTMFTSIVKNTATLIAKWQVYGFNHGVMNTDNMSIHGITFDYGPYAFFDDFEPHYICNKSDHQGRYRFSQQPSIGLWDLNALAQAFRPFASIEDITSVLDQYESTLVTHYHELMIKRFGLTEVTDTALEMMALFMRLLQSAQAVEAKQTPDEDTSVQVATGAGRDYHNNFRQLCGHADWAEMAQLRDHHLDIELFDQWLAAYQAEAEAQAVAFSTMQANMTQTNPHTVLRNHHAQAVIAAAEEGDYSLFHAYLSALSDPFNEASKIDQFAAAPLATDKGIALSCSS